MYTVAMSRESLLIAIGIVVALSPFLGIPLWLLSIILPLLGLGVVAFAISMRTRTKRVRDLHPAPSYEPAEA
jgi:hypothetical protein